MHILDTTHLVCNPELPLSAHPPTGNCGEIASQSSVGTELYVPQMTELQPWFTKNNNFKAENHYSPIFFMTIVRILTILT